MAVVLCGLLIAATLAAFWPVLGNDFINYDDPFYVTDNPHVRSGLNWANFVWAFTAMHAGNWHPVTWISHMLDCQLYGLNPMGHHATNLLLHAINAVLVLLLLRGMTGSLWRSALVAAFFALHPLRVESVAWVSERKDVLSAFFGLLTLLAYGTYARKAEIGKAESKNPKRWVYYGLTLGLYALGLMSKPMLVTWPFLMLLLDYWPLQRFTIHGFRFTRLRPLIAEKIPFLLMAAGACILTVLAQRKGGAIWTAEEIPFLIRLANAMIGYGWYMMKLFWPVDLAVIYPLQPEPQAATVMAGAFLFCGMSALACWQRERRPQVFVGWCWFVGTLVPVIGLVQVGLQSYADRYAYVPHIGVLLAGIWWVAGFFGHTRQRQMLAGVIAGIGLAACGVLTRQQTRHWHDAESLFTHALRVTRNNSVAQFNLGAEFSERKEYERATRCYEAALQIAPQYADALNNLGVASLALKRTEDALAAFREAARLKPNDARIMNGLGTALHTAGDHTNAVAAYGEAVRLAPANAEGYFNLANAQVATGETGKALQNYEQALKLRPDYAEARINRGHVALGLGQRAVAKADFEEALKQLPDAPQAHFGLAQIAGDEGDAKTESERLRFVVNLQPSHIAARIRLAMVLARQGQREEALREMREVIRLRPDQSPAHYCLGVLLEQQGQAEAAAAAYIEALRLQPDAPEVLNNLAWLRATGAEARIRNGAEAVRLAERACELTRYQQPLLVGTLAAAYAEAGRFDDAVRAAEKAASLATVAGNAPLAQRNDELKQLYLRRKAYRQVSVPSTTSLNN